METLRASMQAQEAENKAIFEDFALKNQENEFLTNLMILKMRSYHYKELLKVYAINVRSDHF